MLTLRLRGFTLALAGACVLAVTTAQAAGTSQQQCQVAKNRTVAKYAACRENVEAKLVASGNTNAYAQSILRCEYRFASLWAQAETKAAAAGATCLDAPLDQAAVAAVIDDCTTNVATALAGGGLFDCPATQCGNGTIEAPEQCDGANLNGQTCATRPGFALGTLRCASGCTFDTSGCFATRFTDNGDGTVTDHQTGLQWEKKQNLDSTPNFADPHDADNPYTWCADANHDFACDNASQPPDGTAFTDFLIKLNGSSSDFETLTGCFAGRCDWRLPTIAELRTILLHVAPCGTSPCIDAVFGPTRVGFPGFGEHTYWSSTPNTNYLPHAFSLDFSDGDGYSVLKSNASHIRAVRGGS